jgi:hypothetical protein
LLTVLQYNYFMSPTLEHQGLRPLGCRAAPSLFRKTTLIAGETSFKLF